MGLNTKSPGVRRILEEAKEIQAEPSVDFVAAPSEVPPHPLRLEWTEELMRNKGERVRMVGTALSKGHDWNTKWGEF